MIQTTQIIGNLHLRLPTLDSTNRYALNLVSKSKPAEGTVISAVAQTKGKGQSDNIWESEPEKNVTMSVILYPAFLQPREQFRLNQAISLAVWDAVHDLVGESAGIKWPNDIYVGGKKICGLLIQNSITSQKIQSTVVGIGLNVNQENFSSALLNATSLKNELGREVELNKVFELLFIKISQYYLQLRTRNFVLLDRAYHKRLYRLGEEATFKNNIEKTFFSGKIVGTTEFGKLKIRKNNEVNIFDLKEITFL